MASRSISCGSAMPSDCRMRSAAVRTAFIPSRPRDLRTQAPPVAQGRRAPLSREPLGLLRDRIHFRRDLLRIDAQRRKLLANLGIRGAKDALVDRVAQISQFVD